MIDLIIGIIPTLVNITTDTADIVEFSIIKDTLPFVSTIIVGIIGFFLLRFFKSIDKKLETLSSDVNANILATNTIKTEQVGWNEKINETQVRLETFMGFMQESTTRMNDKIERGDDENYKRITANKESIIRLEERERSLLTRIDKIENTKEK